MDGSYVAWHTAMGNPMLRWENFVTSSGLYFIAGAVWLYPGSLRELATNLRGVLRPTA